MDTLLALAEDRKRAPGAGMTRVLAGGARAAWHHDRGAFTTGAALGALTGGFLAASSAWMAQGTLRGAGLLPATILAAAGGTLGGFIGSALHLGRIVTRDVPANYYGMCTGRASGAATPGPEVLTDWLSASLDHLAGRDASEPPLTFEDLSARGIKLCMLTTNLSQGRPYQLPFSQNVFLFNEHDMSRLFPDKVVRHLIEHRYRDSRISLRGLPGYHYLPVGDKLPVIVAARLSLSFPMLVSAVPLYAIRHTAYRKPAVDLGDLQTHWFSDGGISSNFPVHLFDSWLPARPTFGIKLTSMPRAPAPGPAGTRSARADGAAPAAPGQRDRTADTARAAVYLPKSNRALLTQWSRIEGVAAFLLAIFEAAQNHRDNMQAMLPSYRDRVVQVRLSDREGGLNLTMDAETIKAVASKGAQAGRALRDEFNFDHHRWVRLRVLMAQLETELYRMKQTFLEEDYESLLAAVPASQGEGFPYRVRKPWSDEALRRLSKLRTLIDDLEQQDHAWQQGRPRWEGESFFAHDSPKPTPVLRVLPDS